MSLPPGCIRVWCGLQIPAQNCILRMTMGKRGVFIDTWGTVSGTAVSDRSEFLLTDFKLLCFIIPSYNLIHIMIFENVPRTFTEKWSWITRQDHSSTVCHLTPFSHQTVYIGCRNREDGSFLYSDLNLNVPSSKRASSGSQGSGIPHNTLSFLPHLPFKSN